MESAITLAKVAEMLDGELKGDGGAAVESISSPSKYVVNSIAPFWEKKFAGQVKPGMVLLTKRGWTPAACSGVEVDDPRRSLVTLLAYFEKKMRAEQPAGVHPTAVVAADALLGAGVFIGPNCVVESGASLGDGCSLLGGVWVGSGVKIGAGTVIEYGAVIYHSVKIGSRCIIHSNAVIGCDGFGFMPDPRQGLLRIPQVGTVVIGDNAEIGVGTTIDRATFGETSIGNCVKIDAQVKIGHNCSIGDFCIVVAQAGIAGSSTLGRGVTMAAQSGVANHAAIGDGATVAARGGAFADVAPGAVVSGFPAVEHRQDLRQLAAIQQLPALLKKIRELEAKVERLEGEKS